MLWTVQSNLLPGLCGKTKFVINFSGHVRVCVWMVKWLAAWVIES